MTEENQVEKSIEEQQLAHLLLWPKYHDVTFPVGKNQLILRAASPVCSDDEQNCKHPNLKEGDGKPLSGYLSLIRLCAHFRSIKGITTLEKSGEAFIRIFNQFEDTGEFLKMSWNDLDMFLGCDEIPLSEKDILECVCRWAKHQCKEKKMEPTGGNLRRVLDISFYQIRFASMELQEFETISRLNKNMFDIGNLFFISDYIRTDEDKKDKYYEPSFMFNTKARNPFACSVLRLPPTQFKRIDNPPYVCDGNYLGQNGFKVNKEITLFGVGFLGPIDGDTQFDVTIQIWRIVNGSYTYNSGTFKKNIFARKGKIFYFLFKNPITVEPDSPNSDDRSETHRDRDSYYIDFTLKGAHNEIVPQYREQRTQHKHESVKISGVEFKLDSAWNYGSPAAELLFKTI